MNWAKFAAQDIVSDDAIDEADADRTSSSDWLKWALAAGVLTAGGFAAWKYRPEIQKALSDISLFNNKTTSNRAAETLSGGATSSPAVIGAVVGGLPTLPISDRLSGSRLLGGGSAEHQTIQGIAKTEARSGQHSGNRVDSNEVANEIRRELVAAGVGGEGLASAHQAGMTSENSALGRLHNLNFRGAPQDWNTFKGIKLAPDKGIGADRRAAIRQTNQLSDRLVDLGNRLSSSVTYTPPGAAAPVTVPLSEVPDTHSSVLTGHDATAWHANRQLAREAGVTDPTKFKQFNPALLGAAIQKSKTFKPEFNWEHTGGRALIGAVGGAGVGYGIDTLAGQ